MLHQRFVGLQWQILQGWIDDGVDAPKFEFGIDALDADFDILNRRLANRQTGVGEIAAPFVFARQKRVNPPAEGIAADAIA